MSNFDKPVLAFDTAFGGCVVAVLLPNGKNFSKVMETDRAQAAMLMPMIVEVVGEAGIEFSDVGLIVTTLGPGSFTGLRISLSAARAMSLSLNISVQGVSTFEAMYHSCGMAGDGMVVIESKRTDFYCQNFGLDGKPFAPPRCLMAGEITAERICGDAKVRLVAEGVRADYIDRKLPDPVILARLGVKNFIKNGKKPEKPTPFYMRGADVSISPKSNREIDLTSY